MTFVYKDQALICPNCRAFLGTFAVDLPAQHGTIPDNVFRRPNGDLARNDEPIGDCECGNYAVALAQIEDDHPPRIAGFHLASGWRMCDGFAPPPMMPVAKED